MKQPAGKMVACYTAGILLAAILHPSLRLSLCAAGLLLALVPWLRKFRFYALSGFLLLLGLANFTWRTEPGSPSDLRLLIGTNQVLTSFRGTLNETPRQKISVKRDFQTYYSVARVQVHQIQLNEQWRPATGEIIASTRGILAPDFCRGQNVEIHGVLSQPSGPLAEGLFDYRGYLAIHGIYYQLKADDTNFWSRSPPLAASPPLSDRFLQWSKRTMAYGLPVEDEPLRLLWAMTLGWRTGFSGDISEPFLRAGTMHLFAIDGLRIALVSGIIITLLRTLGLSRVWAGAIIIPLIWFYTGATGWSPPAIRASIMMTIVIGGWALKRPGDLLNSLAVGALAILLWDPRQLFDAGFQLSFLVVLVIAVMLPRLQTGIDRWLQYDPLLPKQLLSARQLQLQSWARSLANLLAVSFTAWVASVPLAAKYFHLFSPVSTAANLFAVPLGTLALTANLAALACGGWFPWATACFNHAAWFFMCALTWVSQTSSNLPAAYFYVPEPSWWTIILYYAVVLTLFSGWLANRSRWRRFLVIATLAAIVPLTRGIISWRSAQLTILPLNGGQSCILDAPGQAHDWVVNCGDDDSAHAILIPFLQAQGFNRLSHVALTEGEERNYGGIVSLDEKIPIGELCTSHTRFRSLFYSDAVAYFDQPPSRHHYFERNASLDGWQQLQPVPGDHFSRADDQTTVLRGTICGTKILLLSDLGRSGQDALLNKTNDLSADILVSGIPEKGEPLCDDLINACAPQLIVIIDAEFPPSLRATPELRQRLARHHLPVLYTSVNGAVTITFASHHWRFRAMR